MIFVDDFLLVLSVLIHIFSWIEIVKFFLKFAISLCGCIMRFLEARPGATPYPESSFLAIDSDAKVG